MSGDLPSSSQVVTHVYYNDSVYRAFGFDDSTTKTIDDVRDRLVQNDVNLSENLSYKITIYNEDDKMDFVLTNSYLREVRPWQNTSPTKKTVKLRVIEDIRPEPQPSVQFVEQPDIPQNNDQQASIRTTQEDNEPVIAGLGYGNIDELMKEFLANSNTFTASASLSGIDDETLLAELNQLRLSFIADLREDQRFQYLSDDPTMLQSDKVIPYAQRHPLLQIPNTYVQLIENGTPVNLIIAVVVTKLIDNERYCYLAPHRGFLLRISGDSSSNVEWFYNPIIQPIKKEQLKKITHEGKQITVIELKLCLMYPKGGATKDLNPQLIPFDENFVLLKEHPVPSNVNQRSNRAETNSNEHIQNVPNQNKLRLKCLLHTDGAQNGLDWSTCCELKQFLAEPRQGVKRSRTMSSS